MRPLKMLSIALLIIMTAVTGYALATVGYVGIFEYHLPSPAGWQVFTDLVVALILVCSWMIVDARKKGRNVLPYLLVTLFLGSFGPLVYLLFAPGNKYAAGSLETG